MYLDAHTVRSIVGGLDDHDVARIAETGATEDELREAARRLEGADEMPSLESHGSARVRQLVQILERIAMDEEEADGVTMD